MDRRFALTHCWRRGYSNRRSHPTKSLVSRRNKEVCLRAFPASREQTRPAVRIPSPPATRHCEPPVPFAFFEGGPCPHHHFFLDRSVAGSCYAAVVLATRAHSRLHRGA